jgi:exonuclease III
MAKFLRIAQWNANGLDQHKEEVQLFLQHNKIDILRVSETKFTTNTHFRIPQYNTYYTNHPDGTAHAGTAILVKQTIQHYELSQYAPELLQATSICVRTFPFEMTVSAVYSLPPPKYNLKKEQYEAFFSTLGPRFMAGGDFNSKHTAWGLELLPLKAESCLVSWNNKTTHSYRLAAPHIGPRTLPSDLIS